MAEEAFALSPISARPHLPGEADYEAIREAFMETARGRWFLAEYAKRNRTADTNILLDAVTRLEAGLAAQRQPQALGLVAALGAIRAAVRQAKATAIEALPRVDNEAALSGARNAARIISEISSTLRQCGADIRICDLLDTQVKAIETGQQTLNGNGRDEALASYDLLMQRIEQLADSHAAAPALTEAAPGTPVQLAEIREASVTPLFRPQPGEPRDEPTAVDSNAPKATPALAEVAATTAEVVAPMAEAIIEGAAATSEADAVGRHAEPLADAEIEYDLAVLDMIALEMGAPDHSEPDVAEPTDVVDPSDVAPKMAAAGAVVADTAHTGVAETVAPEMVVPAVRSALGAPQFIAPRVPEPSADLMTLAEIAEVALAPAPRQAPAQQRDAQPEPSSLGAALIANGVIANPNARASDPLAPIRKMTQAEKIAFFS